MQRERFDDYIDPDMRMLNGALEFRGAQGMREHYCKRIWPHFQEELHVERFVSDDTTLAVQMWTRFAARRRYRRQPGAGVPRRP